MSFITLRLPDEPSPSPPEGGADAELSPNHPSHVPLASDSLASRVETETRSGAFDLPVLPRVAQRVRQAVADERGSREIVTIVEQDPALAASLLRLANSATYAGLREVTDLNQAVLRLGLSNVDRTVLALAARQAFAPSAGLSADLYRGLWTHAMTTAIASRRLVPRNGTLNPETVFLAALLHDVGKVVVLRCAEMLRKRHPKRFAFEGATLVEFFDALHCRTGDVLADAWHLPADIREVIRRHHEAHLRGPDDALVAIVQLANRIATKIGANLRPDPDVALLDTPGAALLRLDDVRVAALLVDIEDDVRTLGQGLL